MHQLPLQAIDRRQRILGFGKRRAHHRPIAVDRAIAHRAGELGLGTQAACIEQGRKNAAADAWAAKRGIRIDFIQPG